MKVLHIDTAVGTRPGWEQLLDVVRFMPDAVVGVSGTSPLRRELEDMGITTHVIPAGLRAPFAVERLIGAGSFDLVAAHTSVTTALIGARGRVPVVVHQRGLPGNASSPKYRAVAGFVAVSQSICSQLAETGVAEGRIAMVPDGVSAEPFVNVSPEARQEVRRRLDIPLDAPLVGAVGRLDREGGHRVFVEALAWIDNQRQDVFSVIVGEGPELAELSALATKWGIAQRTRFVASHASLPALVCALDLFCYPGLVGGAGQTVVKAMLAGTPVVATSAAGISEIITDVEMGVLVAPDDGPALSRAILAVLRTPERSQERAAVAEVSARERFSVDRMVEATSQAYQRFMQASS